MAAAAVELGRPGSATTPRHTERNAIRRAVLSWYLRPDSEVDGGTRGKHAVYWRGGTAAVLDLAAEDLPTLVAEARSHFSETRITLDVYGAIRTPSPGDGERLAIGAPVLPASPAVSGFRWARDFVYLAHVGPLRQPRYGDLTVVPVGGANIHDAMMVKQHGFNGRVTIAGILAEMARRGTEWYGERRAVVAYRGRQPVGFLQQQHAPDGAFIKYLSVVPNHQGHGVGTLLLRHALRHQPAGRWMIINTTYANTGALRLYHREGFTDTVVVRRQFHEMEV